MKTKRKFKKLTIKHLSENALTQLDIPDEEGYYINDPNNENIKWVGPYETKKESIEARQGLERFYRNND